MIPEYFSKKIENIQEEEAQIATGGGGGGGNRNGFMVFKALLYRETRRVLPSMRG